MTIEPWTLEEKKKQSRSESGSSESATTEDASAPYYNPKGLNWFVTGLFVVGDLAGGGIVALPTAIIQSELYYGIILFVVMLFCVTYTAYVLGLSWNILLNTWPEYRHHCRKPYPEIGRRALGPLCGKLVSLCIDVTQFGIAVVYIILCANNIHNFLKQFCHVEFSFCLLILIIAGLLLPVTFLKSPQDFWWAVVIAMITTSCAVVLIVVGSAIDLGTCSHISQMPDFRVTNIFLALGTFLFSFGGHPAFPTIQHDMKNPKEFTKSVALAFSIMAVMYVPVCFMGWYVYGDSLRDSVIPSIQTVGIQQAINLLITVHCFLTLTIVFNPINQEVEDLFHVPQKFCWQRVVVRTSILLAVVFVAESVPTFGPLLDLVGGSTLTLTSVILPCLFYLFLNANKQKTKATGKLTNEVATLSEVWRYNSKITVAICIFVMAFGLFGGGAATYSAIKELTTTQFKYPCYLFKKSADVSSESATNCCGPFQNVSIFNNIAKCSAPDLNFYNT